MEELRTQIDAKLARTSQMSELAHEKARNYNQRLQEKLDKVNQEKDSEKDTLMFKIEEKLTNAAQRRENLIEQVKTTAAQSAIPKPAGASCQEEN